MQTTLNEQLLIAYGKETQSSFMDNLTGVFNHGIFQILLEAEINRSQRYGDIFTLAMLDIDAFSRYNRQHNPAIGDQALRNVAQCIRENLRIPDFAARYSGDVFAIILMKTSVHDAYTAMDRIRDAIAAESAGKLTVSIGLAAFPREASNRENLILKAQEVLLKAKLTGRNKVCFLEEENKTAADQQSKILIVDDDPRNVKLLNAFLLPYNHDIFKAYSGEEALSIIKKVDIDLVLLDVMMPDMDGYEVCRRIKKNEATRMVPIIMVTALDDTEARVKGIEVGVDDFITKPPNRVELMARINSLLKVNALNKKLTHIESVIISMANAVEAKDAYTQGHIERVANLAVALGRKLGLSAVETDALWYSGILHDIGKIGVPRNILNKPGPLDTEEWEIVKCHPVTSFNICLPLKKILGPALEAIRHHHEKIDGSGYPDGLKGDDISLLARILAVVDIFDALDTDRPYRKGMPREQTFKILCNEANEGKLDTIIVAQLMEMLDKTADRGGK